MRGKGLRDVEVVGDKVAEPVLVDCAGGAGDRGGGGRGVGGAGDGDVGAAGWLLIPCMGDEGERR